MPEVLVPLGGCAMIVLIVWLGLRSSQAKTKARTEVQTKLLEKFDSGRELAEFLGSEGSKRLLEELGSERASPQERILKSVKAGIVLTALGLGFLGLMVQDQEMIVPAMIILALGVGFLVAAAVSHRLYKNWGLYKNNEEPASQL